MLVIERREGDAVCIGDDIRIVVKSRKGRRGVKLGIAAPVDVPIVREELLDRAPSSSSGTASSNGTSSDVAPSNGTAAPVAPPAGARERPLRVAIVEDDENHAELIRMALESSGATDVVQFSSGREALERLMVRDMACARPDLILLDLRLADVDGLEVLSALRAHPLGRTIPVVILSSSQADEEVGLCLARGANAFIEKAVRYSDLKDSIARITRFWSHVRVA